MLRRITQSRQTRLEDRTLTLSKKSENCGLGDTGRDGEEDRDISTSIAQSLTPEILHAIFSYLVNDDDYQRRRLTLRYCTLVCRSWSLESSAILVMHTRLHCWPPEFSGHTRQGDTVTVLGLQFRRKITTRSTHQLQESLKVVLQSARIAANLHKLEVYCCHKPRGCIGFASLQAVVMHLRNLRSLVLISVHFKPVGLGKRLRSQVIVPPEERRQLESLVLCGYYRNKTHSANPSVFDVLLWFDAVHRLDITQISPYQEVLGSQEQLGASHALNLPVEHLVLGPSTIEGYPLVRRPLHMLDLQYLRSLKTTHLDQDGVAGFNAFLRVHGHRLEHCSVSVLLSAWTSMESSSLVRAAPSDRLIFAPPTNLRTLSFDFVIPIRLNLVNTDSYSFWNHSLENILAIPTLEELRIEIEIDNCLSYPLNGSDTFFPILNSLHWSLLGQPLQVAERRLEESRLSSVRLAIWCRGGNLHCSSLTDGKSDYVEFIKSKVSAAAQTRLLFEGGKRN